MLYCDCDNILRQFTKLAIKGNAKTLCKNNENDRCFDSVVRSQVYYKAKGYQNVVSYFQIVRSFNGYFYRVCYYKISFLATEKGYLNNSASCQDGYGFYNLDNPSIEEGEKNVVQVLKPCFSLCFVQVCDVYFHISCS